MMKKHPLLKIFAPLIVALILVMVVLTIPQYSKHYNRTTLSEAAVSLSANVMRGESIKNQATRQNYVPFFGSSELSRIDAMHPSVLAKKYHRSYTPFLLGKAGTQSLSQYFNITSMAGTLKNKKAVFIVSPQWFTKQGQSSDAFAYYFSSLATTQWTLRAKDSATTRYAAKRVLDMGNVNQFSALGRALARLSHGKQLTEYQHDILVLKERVLRNEDSLFGDWMLKDNNLYSVDKQIKRLPSRYSFDELDKIAVQTGRRETNSNRFHIFNHFYKHRLNNTKLQGLRGSQKKFDYRRSPEYGDFQLVLSQFAKQNTDVLFVIPPVNKKWADYTGLSEKMLKQTDKKIKLQLKSQGFNNIVDLTNAGNVNYFMQDTIHLGWRGWLALDQYVRPFMKKDRTGYMNYHLNSSFYTRNWQNWEVTK